eukprot:4986518-Lingulodinium_polyedra.AAC.1
MCRKFCVRVAPCRVRLCPTQPLPCFLADLAWRRKRWPGLRVSRSPGPCLVQSRRHRRQH